MLDRDSVRDVVSTGKKLLEAYRARDMLKTALLGGDVLMVKVNDGKRDEEGVVLELKESYGKLIEVLDAEIALLEGEFASVV